MSYNLPSPALNQVNYPATYRTYSWLGMVLNAWGAQWGRPEIGYQFSNGREFYAYDKNQGPYA